MANEKDAMALAVLDRAAAVAYTRCECPDSIACTECNLAAPYRQARAHLASRIAELEADNERLRGAFDTEDEKASVHWYGEWVEQKRRSDRAEAELAAVREWLAKLESFVGPGALAYIRREFDAARSADQPPAN